MFDEDDNKKNDRGQKKPPGGFNFPTFTWVAWIAIIGTIAALMLVYKRNAPQPEILSQAGFFQKYESNQIAQATISYSMQSGDLAQIAGTYKTADKDGK